ncbi:hypothetical protein, partial [Bordetella pseudohinzii]|uniref:hypothetical protein n=1 Tax=Bordetella pseudohinzii TaxID=1331258 RepID=UPI001F2FB83D
MSFSTMDDTLAVTYVSCKPANGQAVKKTARHAARFPIRDDPDGDSGVEAAHLARLQDAGASHDEGGGAQGDLV